MYVITAACVDRRHGECAIVCPSSCIACDPEDRIMFIDPVVCIDCRGCVASCPENAIRAPFELRPEDLPFDEISRLWYSDKAAARARLDALVPRKAPVAALARPA